MDDDIKSVSVRFRLTPQERAILVKAAQMEGIDLSVMMRGCARREAIRIFAESGLANPFLAGAKKAGKKKKT